MENWTWCKLLHLRIVLEVVINIELCVRFILLFHNNICVCVCVCVCV